MLPGQSSLHNILTHLLAFTVVTFLVYFQKTNHIVVRVIRCPTLGPAAVDALGSTVHTGPAFTRPFMSLNLRCGIRHHAEADFYSSCRYPRPRNIKRYMASCAQPF